MLLFSANALSKYCEDYKVNYNYWIKIQISEKNNTECMRIIYFASNSAYIGTDLRTRIINFYYETTRRNKSTAATYVWNQFIASFIYKTWNSTEFIDRKIDHHKWENKKNKLFINIHSWCINVEISL